MKWMNYSIQAGDTLSSIAARGDVDASWWDLWEINRPMLVAEQVRRFGQGSPFIGLPHYIFPGTVIHLPAKEGRAVPARSPE